MRAHPVIDGDVEQAHITTALDEILTHRATIEQAKGMLMLVYGVPAETAFEVLKWRSQVTNTKLRSLAERIVIDFAALFPDDVHRDRYDHALVTVHLRAHDGH